MTRLPWTQEELNVIVPRLKKETKSYMQEIEDEYENIKPLSTMTLDEAKDLFFRFIDLTKGKISYQVRTFYGWTNLSSFRECREGGNAGQKRKIYCC